MKDPNLLVGLDVSDDAAVYRVNDDTAVIQTLDFFTPVVDSPYDYGAVAAANALSDVYAMGGRAVLALNIAAFPSGFPSEIIAEILRGGAEKVAEAGAVLAGGHTITDEEPKYGLSVMGLVHPERVLKKSGAKPGDILVITKPLGTGIITTAAKSDCAEPHHIEAAVVTMKRLNKTASEALQECGAHACTDITGFSLLGHTLEMAEKSGVGILLHAAALPFLEGAEYYADENLFPGGACRNRDTYKDRIRFATDIREELQLLLYTPETSGGLMGAVPEAAVPAFEDLCRTRGQFYAVIGKVTEGEGIVVDE